MSAPRHIPQLFTGLPPSWSEERLVDIVDLLTSNVDKKSHDGEEPVKLCNYVDVYYNDKIDNSLSFMPATASKNQIEKFGLKVGDVIITKDSESPNDIGIPALVIETASDLVCGYHLTMLKPDEEKVNGSYLFYAVASGKSAHQFYLASNGVTRFGLTSNGTKNLRIALPPLQTQKKIADFLDRKMAQIDGLIEKKRQLIAKLKEKRLAVITQAVTCGLNPDAPLKDSGIEWLGQVPEHWITWKLTHAFGVIGSGTTPKSDSQEYYDGKHPWVTTSELRETVIKKTKNGLTKEALDNYSALKTYPKGAILFAMYGATIGRLGILGIPATVNQACCVFTDPERIEPKFLYYWLLMRKRILIMLSQGGGQPNLSKDDLKQIRIPSPTIHEQKEICSYLDLETPKIDILIELIGENISKLTEYRTALITAAVTGQLEVD